MCGGGNDNAAKAAEAREREAQQRIAANSQRVNSVFDDPARQSQIGDFINASRAIYSEELNRQMSDNTRQLDFALARSGQTGASLDVDLNTDLGEAYQRGTVESERGVQAGANSIRAADEEARGRLLALVQSGGDIGNNTAATSMRNNLEAGKSALDVSSIGNVFGSLANVYSKSKQQSDYRRGLFDYNTLYSPNFGTNVSVGGAA